jgi:integrase
MASIYQLGIRSGARRGCYYTNVPRELGAPAQRSTGTQDRKLAQQIGRMVDELGPRGKRRWDLLRAVTDGRLTLAQLWDTYSKNGVEGLAARLNDVDLSPLVEDFASSHAKRVTPAHAKLAKIYVRRFIPDGKPFLRSSLTPNSITRFFDSLEVKTTAKENPKLRAAASGTKLKHHAALSAFFRWAMMAGHLNENPLRHIEKPKPGLARSRHLSFANVLRLIEATPVPFKAIESLAHCGMEVSAILRLTRGDVNLAEGTVHAKGTKTAWRDRTVPIQEWAQPHVKAATRGKHPAAKLFPEILNGRVYDVHEATCEKLGAEFAHYRFHDARRSFAITALKNGATHEAVAYILGHKDASLVLRVYGRYAPNLDALRACDPTTSATTQIADARTTQDGAR